MNCLKTSLKKNEGEKINEIKDEFTCSICLDTVKHPASFQIPASKICEEHLNHLIHKKVFCLKCLYDYVKLSNYRFIRHPQNCKCVIDKYDTIKLVQHTELWKTLDIINDNNLECQYCGAECYTQMTYNRHLKDRLLPSSKVKEACPNYEIKCNYCDFKGKRYIVNGYHYEEEHNRKLCTLCNSKIKANDFEKHISTHEDLVNNVFTKF